MKLQKLLFVFFCHLLIIFIHAAPLLAGSLTLSWQSPSFSKNGSRLIDLAGYKIYYGEGSGSYYNVMDIGNRTTYTISNINDAVTYYFTVTSYDLAGNESDYAQEVVRHGSSVPMPTYSASSHEDAWTEDFTLDAWTTTYNLSNPAMDFKETVAGKASISAVRTGSGCATMTIALPEELSLNPLYETMHFDVYTEDFNEKLSLVRFQTPDWSHRIKYLFSPQLSLHSRGWSVVELNLSDFVLEAGSLDWNSIGKISFSFCGGSQGSIKIDNLYFTSSAAEVSSSSVVHNDWDEWTEDYALDTWSTTYNMSAPVVDYRETVAGNSSISVRRTGSGCATMTVELPEELSLNPLYGTMHFDVYTEDFNEKLSIVRFQTPYWSDRMRYLFSPQLSLHNRSWTVVELNLSDFVVEAGSPDWNSIGKISFSFCGGSQGSIIIDNLYFTN